MSSNETRYRAQVETEFGDLPGVAASEPRLAQVFLNVLVNAAQAFPEGRCPQECKIRIVTSQDQDGKIVIEVSDNGPGIRLTFFRGSSSPSSPPSRSAWEPGSDFRCVATSRSPTGGPSRPGVRLG